MAIPKKSKRDLLFNAAMSIIGERGYGGASVDEIASRAGVAKGVVYYYFDSKAALAEQLIKTGLDALAVRLERAITPEMSASEAITALAHEQMRQIQKRRDFAKFLLSEMWREDRAWRETLDKSVGGIVDIFAREVARGIDAGDFSPRGIRFNISDAAISVQGEQHGNTKGMLVANEGEDVRFIAQTIWATFLAGALNWTVIHPDDDPRELANRLAQFALAGLRS